MNSLPPSERHICHEDHIAYLLAAAMQIQDRYTLERGAEPGTGPPFFWMDEEGNRRELHPETFRETGQMLLDRNLLAWREGMPGPRNPDRGMKFRVTGATIKPWVRLEAVEVIRSAEGYAMNAGGQGWKGSEARSFIRKLIRLATWQLPGYDRASLGAPHRMEDLMTLERKQEASRATG